MWLNSVLVYYQTILKFSHTFVKYLWKYRFNKQLSASCISYEITNNNIKNISSWVDLISLCICINFVKPSSLIKVVTLCIYSFLVLHKCVNFFYIYLSLALAFWNLTNAGTPLLSQYFCSIISWYIPLVFRSEALSLRHSAATAWCPHSVFNIQRKKSSVRASAAK